MGFSEVAREEVISHPSTKHSNFPRPHFIIIGEPHLGRVVKSFHGIQKFLKDTAALAYMSQRNDTRAWWDLSSGSSFGTCDC